MRTLPLWILSALLLPACGGSEKPGNANSGNAGAGGGDRPAETEGEPEINWAAEADKKFKVSCALCHGSGGKGDAPTVEAWPLKPKDLTDPEWQASVDDDYLRKIILEGGAAVGKSALMTGAPDLKDKPELLDALVAKIRGFAKEG